MAEEERFIREVNKVYRLISLAIILAMMTVGFMTYYMIDPNFSAFNPEVVNVVSTSTVVDENSIENGIHVRTGLIEAEGLMTVVNNCTSCHSSKLIIQNRMNTESWNATIKWMQETQNLWPLGKNQEVIVNYLVTNYPPKAKGRRENLSNIDWYELED